MGIAILSHYTTFRKTPGSAVRPLSPAWTAWPLRPLLPPASVCRACSCSWSPPPPNLGGNPQIEMRRCWQTYSSVPCLRTAKQPGRPTRTPAHVLVPPRASVRVAVNQKRCSSVREHVWGAGWPPEEGRGAWFGFTGSTQCQEW